MDGILRKHAVRLVGLALALLTLASLLTFHPQDPTFTNLRYPKDGIANWAGYPGALIGGSAVEAFGWAALLLPLLIANGFTFRRNRPPVYRYALHGFTVTLVVAAAFGMGTAPPTLGLSGPGLLGWTAGQWMLVTLGPWPGAASLAFAGGYSIAQVAYAQALRRVTGDARTFARFGIRQLGATLLAKWRLLRPQTGWAWHELLLLPFQALLAGAWWLWDRGINRPLLLPLGSAWQGLRERRYSVARVKRSPSAALAPMMTPQEEQPRFRPASTAPAPSPAPDAFAGWASEPDDDIPEPSFTAPPAARPEPLPGPTQSAPPPLRPLPTETPDAPRGEARVQRWEEYLRRYKENLDLDWDERSWKRKRLEDLAGEAEDPQPPEQPK